MHKGRNRKPPNLAAHIDGIPDAQYGLGPNALEGAARRPASWLTVPLVYGRAARAEPWRSPWPGPGPARSSSRGRASPLPPARWPARNPVSTPEGTRGSVEPPAPAREPGRCHTTALRSGSMTSPRTSPQPSTPTEWSGLALAVH